MKTKPIPGLEHFDGFFENVHKDHKDWCHELCANLEPVFKVYPDIKPTEYVLWINESIILPTNFYESLSFESLSVKLCILDDSNNLMKDLTNEIRIGTTGKIYKQMRLKNGRSSVKGIPLRFKSFEELKNVKTITVTWQSEFESTNDKSIVSLQHIAYHLDFIPDEHKHFYTVCDESFCYIVPNGNKFHNWLSDFDNTEVESNFSEKCDSVKLQQLVTEYGLDIDYNSDIFWTIIVCEQNVNLKPTDFAFIESCRQYFSNEEMTKYQEFIDYHDMYYK